MFSKHVADDPSGYTLVHPSVWYVCIGMADDKIATPPPAFTSTALSSPHCLLSLVSVFSVHTTTLHMSMKCLTFFLDQVLVRKQIGHIIEYTDVDTSKHC